MRPLHRFLPVPALGATACLFPAAGKAPVAESADRAASAAARKVLRNLVLTLQSTFRWSGKEGAAFQARWRATFDDFTETKRLQDRPWVFNPNGGPGAATR